MFTDLQTHTSIQVRENPHTSTPPEEQCITPTTPSLPPPPKKRKKTFNEHIIFNFSGFAFYSLYLILRANIPFYMSALYITS
jgi:hypothetical protein